MEIWNTEGSINKKIPELSLIPIIPSASETHGIKERLDPPAKLVACLPEERVLARIWKPIRCRKMLWNGLQSKRFLMDFETNETRPDSILILPDILVSALVR